jgi:hypothetical protein
MFARINYPLFELSKKLRKMLGGTTTNQHDGRRIVSNRLMNYGYPNLYFLHSMYFIPSFDFRVVPRRPYTSRAM